MKLALTKTEIYALAAAGLVLIQLCLAMGISLRGFENGAAVAAGSMWPLPGVGLIATIGGLAAAKGA